MGLFDIFSSSNGVRGATQGYNALTSGLNNAKKDVTSNNATARTDITGNNADALKFLEGGYGDATNNISTGLNQALGYLGNGVNTAAGYLNQATPVWQGLLGQGNAGLNLYGQLAGLGGFGPEQQAALEGTPGYQFTKQQGLDALDRTANARGMLKSGNNTQDILKYATGLADQTYGEALSRLNPYFGLATGAAQGLTGNLGALAALYGNQGLNQANLATNAYGQIADLNNTFGQNRANVSRGQGAALSGISQNQGTQLAGLDQNIGQAGYQYAADKAAAQNAASANLWSALLGLGGGITSAAGNAGGFGTLFS